MILFQKVLRKVILSLPPSLFLLLWPILVDLKLLKTIQGGWDGGGVGDGTGVGDSDDAGPSGDPGGMGVGPTGEDPANTDPGNNQDPGPTPSALGAVAPAPPATFGPPTMADLVNAAINTITAMFSPTSNPTNAAIGLTGNALGLATGTHGVGTVATGLANLADSHMGTQTAAQNTDAASMSALMGDTVNAAAQQADPNSDDAGGPAAIGGPSPLTSEVPPQNRPPGNVFRSPLLSSPYGEYRTGGMRAGV